MRVIRTEEEKNIPITTPTQIKPPHPIIMLLLSLQTINSASGVTFSLRLVLKHTQDHFVFFYRHYRKKKTVKSKSLRSNVYNASSTVRPEVGNGNQRFAAVL
jgi:hypothetical protein